MTQLTTAGAAVAVRVNTSALQSIVEAKCEAAQSRRSARYQPSSPSALAAAGDYLIVGLRDDSDEALIDVADHFAEQFEAEGKITSDDNIAASWAAIDER